MIYLIFSSPKREVWGDIATGIWKTEARGIAKTSYRVLLLTRNRSIQSKISIVLRLRNPKFPLFFCFDLILTLLWRHCHPCSPLKWLLFLPWTPLILLLSLESEVNVIFILQCYFQTILLPHPLNIPVLNFMLLSATELNHLPLLTHFPCIILKSLAPGSLTC